MITRTEWIARCACTHNCTAEIIYDEEADARAVVDMYRNNHTPYRFIRRDHTITDIEMSP